MRRLRITRFMFAPPDLRTTDATVATDIYAGQFVFAGRIVVAQGQSPFDIEPPTEGWADALYSFGWLRHMQAARSALARNNARMLVGDFIRRMRRPAANPNHAHAGKPLVIARRLSAFLAQSPLVLDGADHDFYMLFLAGVRQDARLLRDAMRLSDDPLVHLSATLALTSLGLCVEGGERLERRYGERLSDLLDEQILADGGHVSRNPRVLIELMLDLLPLRSTYAARGLDAPRGLVSAIDRIVPHLKMLRHPDGSVALFNGMGASQVDALATIFASHDSGGRAATEAPYSGYQRIEAGSTVLIAETGPAPPFAASGEAMAGCLSFELSHGRQRLFVNCGVPPRTRAEVPVALRGTAAHTASTVADSSSCSFVTRGGEARIVNGPRRVSVARSSSEAGLELTLVHDGYQRLFGVDLERMLSLAPDGLALTGRERLSGAPRGAADNAALTARFHLHPTVRAERIEDGRVVLTPPRGASWLFSSSNCEASVEESMFYAGIDGARRIQQIVLSSTAFDVPISWRLEQIALPPE